MTTPSYKITFNGEDAEDDIYENIIRLEITEDIQKATSFVFRVSISLQEDGAWSYLDDDRFDFFKKLTISLGFEENQATPYFEGYITHLAPHFDPEEELCYLEVRGMDPTCLMNLEERMITWEDQSHSDIASTIFDQYGITPDVEASPIIHPESGNLLVQRTTDIQFLRQLATQNGYDCYMAVDESGEIKGYFKPYALDVSPLPTLAVHFEGETNVEFIDIEASGNQPLSVAGWYLSQEDKSLETIEQTSHSQTLIGNENLLSLVETSVDSLASPTEAACRVHTDNFVAFDQTELEQYAQNRLDRSSWFIKAKTSINSETYQNIIHARNIIPIKGIGTRYSGNYLVSSVKSIINQGEFEQHLELTRNAWGVTGDEPFEGEE